MENPQLRDVCWQATEQVEPACSEKDKSTLVECTMQANSTFLESLTNAEFVKSLNEWVANKAKNAMFRSIMNYIEWRQFSSTDGTG